MEEKRQGWGNGQGRMSNVLMCGETFCTRVKRRDVLGGMGWMGVEGGVGARS